MPPKSCHRSDRQSAAAHVDAPQLRAHLRPRLFASLDAADLEWFDTRDDWKPHAHAAHGLQRLPVTEDLLALLGFYLAEGPAPIATAD
jgi:hypothetical protein